MHQHYSLLRDNKQTGPYSLSELVQTTLRPFDLIWIEGISGGWRYPSEIDELKIYVQKEDAPAHLKTKNEIKVVNLPVPHTGKVSSHHQMKKKDRLLMDSKSIYVSLPEGVSMPVAQIHADTQEESPEAKLERKALELFQKAQVFSERESRHIKSKNSETKYTRSLEEIKEEYSSWLKQQKNENANPGKKTIALAALMVAITGLAFIGAHYISISTNAVKKQTTAFQPAQVEKRIFQEDAPSIDYEMNTALDSTQSTYNGKIKTAADLHINTSKEDIVNKTAAATIKQDSTGAKAEEKNESKDEAAIMQQNPLINSKETPETILLSETETDRDTKPVPLTQQISIEGKELSNAINEGIKSYQITVRNNSSQVLKVVAVDVFYHQQNGSLLEKKTLYFSDVLPNRALTLAAPGNKNAFTVTHQLGLVSSAGGSLYVSG